VNEEQEKDALRMCNVEKGQKYATQASPTNLKKQNAGTSKACHANPMLSKK